MGTSSSSSSSSHDRRLLLTSIIINITGIQPVTTNFLLSKLVFVVKSLVEKDG